MHAALDGIAAAWSAERDVVVKMEDINKDNRWCTCIDVYSIECP